MACDAMSSDRSALMMAKRASAGLVYSANVDDTTLSIHAFNVEKQNETYLL